MLVAYKRERGRAVVVVAALVAASEKSLSCVGYACMATTCSSVDDGFSRLYKSCVCARVI